MSGGAADPLCVDGFEQVGCANTLPPEHISVDSPPDVIAAWLLQLGFPEQAMCVLKLQVTGHVLGH